MDLSNGDQLDLVSGCGSGVESQSTKYIYRSQYLCCKVCLVQATNRREYNHGYVHTKSDGTVIRNSNGNPSRYYLCETCRKKYEYAVSIQPPCAVLRPEEWARRERVAMRAAKLRADRLTKKRTELQSMSVESSPMRDDVILLDDEQDVDYVINTFLSMVTMDACLPCPKNSDKYQIQSSHTEEY